jgi:hypothetical protein
MMRVEESTAGGSRGERALGGLGSGCDLVFLVHVHGAIARRSWASSAEPERLFGGENDSAQRPEIKAAAGV